MKMSPTKCKMGDLCYTKPSTDPCKIMEELISSSSVRCRLYSSLILASIIISQVVASTANNGVIAAGRRIIVSSRNTNNSRQGRSSAVPLSFIVKKRHPKKQRSQHCPSQVTEPAAVSLGFWLRSQDDMYVELGSTEEENDTPPPSLEHQLAASDDTELLSENDINNAGEGTIDVGNDDIPSTDTISPVVENDTITIENSAKRTSRWTRLSSLSSLVSNTLILPGTPLILRLLPVKPSEVISKIIDEMPLPPPRELPGEDEVEETSPETTAALAMFAAAPNELRQLVVAAPNADTIVNGDLKASYEGEKDEEEALLNHITKNNVDDENDGEEKDVAEEVGDKKKAGFFRRRKRSSRGKKNMKDNTITKEELQCPAIVTNIHEMREAVLINGTSLKDVGFRFPVQGIGSDIVLENDSDTLSPLSKQNLFQRYDPIVNGTLSSLLNCNTASAQNKSEYELGIELINQHNVLELIKERVRTNSTPGDRQSHSPDDEEIPHLALVIEGGGMRGAVSAGMAAALSTLDLLDAFDSVHGSSAGAIVGAYLVSRQLCTDIYTDIMPKAGRKFASTRRGMLNFGVDYLSDLIERKLLMSSSSTKTQPLMLPASQDDDVLCVQIDNDYNISVSDAWQCGDGVSSVEMAMGRIKVKQPSSVFKSRWSDDHYDGVMFESMNYLLSGVSSFAQKTVSKPISFGVRRFGRALRPALDALDFASAMRQYLRRRPGMNLTFVLDGIMDDTHGLRPFDLDAFRANDKRQPLYVISSAVSNGGSGRMETIAFNSAEGDFFGFNDELAKDSESSRKGRVRWYNRLWQVVKLPFTVLSAVRKSLFTSDVVYDSPLPPPGTNAMYGFTNRNKKKKTKRVHEEKIIQPTGRMDDEGKSGIYPCLEASALVPGAAGPPLQLIRSKNRKRVDEKGRFPRWLSRKELNRRKEQNSHFCFDAFCYEPIPFRSAVEKANATHVLALRSRPDGCVVETKQHMYEKIVAPIYFRQNGMKQVAKWFAGGGSQYRYIEDVLTLEEGLARGIALSQNSTNNQDYLQGVKIPPTKIIYGSDEEPVATEIEDWKRAHLLPITLPFGTPELPALSQDKDEVILAVRHGYSAAYDILAPIAGLPFDSATITGERVAELLFPMGEDDVDVLDKRVHIKSSYIGENENEEEMKRRSFAAWITGKREAKRKSQETIASNPDGLLARQAKRRYHESDQYLRDGSNTLEYIEIEALLAALPGFRGGRLDHISENLKKGINNTPADLE